jgi:hypothetical protein
MQTHDQSTRANSKPKVNQNSFLGKEKKPGLFFQPKLAVGPVDDQYEREADAVADHVMSGGEGHIQTKIPSVNIQPKCSHCDEEEKLQRKENGNAIENDNASSIVSDALDSTGQSLDSGTRSFMESHFGYDFSNVKIHTNEVAAKSAQSLNALAYTSGNNIVFNQDQYNPSSQHGKKLLAHELTHVVQQNSGNVQAKKIQRQCLTTAPGSDETPFTFVHRGRTMAAEFSDAAGAESFISNHSGRNLVCHRITHGRHVVFKVFQRATATRTPATRPPATATPAVQDEIFSDAEVSRMRSFFIHNASGGNSLECINTVRSGIGGLIFDDSDLTDGSCPSNLNMTTNNTMEETMTQLGRHSMAASLPSIRFNDSNGTAIQSGSGREPMQLASSVWSAITTAVGSATGWSVFGLSLCDGYHSVTITVDHRVLTNISMFWSDQTTHHPVQTSDRISGVSGSQFGWERMAQTGGSELGTGVRGLDEYIRYAVRRFWGLSETEARGTTALSQDQRNGRTDLGGCFPLVRLWRISRP